MATSREAAAVALASITPGDTSAGRLMGALDSLVTRFDALEKRADAVPTHQNPKYRARPYADGGFIVTRFPDGKTLIVEKASSADAAIAEAKGAAAHNWG